jgi:hypothetical protein
LTDSENGAPKPGLGDVRVLTFLAPGVWQQRHWASDLGDGLYEISFRPEEEGVYYVFLQVASAGLDLQKSPHLTLVARPSAAGQGGTR